MLRKWAYWTGYIRNDEFVATIREMGDQGWELCSMSELQWHSGVSKCYCVFKRPGDVIERF